MEIKEWSYQELADHLGVTKSQAHDWVNENGEPQLKNLRKVARKVDCEVSDLVDD